MSEDKSESWDKMCERLAYNLMRDIARGTDAIRMAHGLAGSVMMWRKTQDDIEKAAKRGK